MGEPIRYRAKRTDSERFGMDVWVTGHYFTTPLTDENSGAPAEAGWFFLAGPDQPTRHLIVDGGTAFTIDPATLEPVAEDVLALLQQNDALRRGVLNNLDVGLAPEQLRPTFIAQLVGVMRSDPEIRRGVLKAVLPSEMDLTGAILVAIDEAQPGDDGNTALVAAKAVRKALEVSE